MTGGMLENYIKKTMPKYNSGNGNRNFGLSGAGKGSAERSSKWREHYNDIDWGVIDCFAFDPSVRRDGQKLVKRYGAAAPSKFDGYPAPPNRVVEAVPFESPRYTPRKWQRLTGDEMIACGDMMTSINNPQHPEPKGLISADRYSGRLAGDIGLQALLFYREVAP